ncbi:DUF6279 family lipoprotein [Algiphilus aromaticivorans]|uniref:DUF6279 family lipoprotein n=1 Tax=Algiphilus aromaticivorans TaxID=382454 RepID=UPI0005C1B3C9|nr:DUF6279 family lipoprotein [Algiphilus aromaticivorans]
MRHTLRLTLLLLLGAGLLSACSTTRLAYNQSHWLVSWQLGGYLELDWSQRSQLRDEFRELRAWHRVNQLDAYAEDLYWLADRIESRDFDREDLDTVIARANRHVATLVERALPHAATVLRDMGDAQLSDLQTRLSADIEEELAERENMDIAQWRERISEDMVEALRDWAGPLEADQHARIARWARERQAPPGIWRAQRKAALEQAFRLFEQRHAEDFVARVEAFVAERTERRPAALRRAAAADREAWKALMLDLEAGMRPRQRAHLVDVLRAYARDAERLAAATK